jgi:hypothetical protein
LARAGQDSLAILMLVHDDDHIGVVLIGILVEALHRLAQNREVERLRLELRDGAVLLESNVEDMSAARADLVEDAIGRRANCRYFSTFMVVKRAEPFFSHVAGCWPLCPISQASMLHLSW